MRGIAITLLFIGLALPAGAAAQNVPPGNSGIDQYKESLPGVGGNRPTGGPGAGTGSGTSSSAGQSRISPSTAKSLNKLGPDGKATAAAAAASAPSPSHQTTSSGNSDPGMGWVLPVILALALAGAVGIVVMRRRGGAPPGPA